MSKRVAGIAYLKVDGNQLPLRGNFTISPAMRVKAAVVGQDGVHGFSEMYRAPSIEGDITLDRAISIASLTGIVSATITATLATGKVYVLREAWQAGEIELNTLEGSARIRFEGASIREFNGAEF